MVKDEADVIEGTLRHMADEVDHILIADNGSTDGTSEILTRLEHELPLTVRDDPETGYFQSRKMSALAQEAANNGATWIVPFDADELWVWRGNRIRDELAACTADVVVADLFNHFASAVDPPGDDAFRTIVHRQALTGALPKVAFRWREGAVIHQGNHGVTLPGQHTSTVGLEVRHFPYRSAEQFISKARNGAAAYAATDLAPTIGQHWREYGLLLDRYGEEALGDVYREHFFFLAPSLSGLTHDPAPYLRWQK